MNLFLLLIIIAGFGCNPGIPSQTQSAGVDKQSLAILQSQDIEPTSGYLARKQAFLDAVLINESIDAQPARVAMNAPVAEDSVNDSLNLINTRTGSAGFRLITLMRMLYIDQETGGLTDELRGRIKNAVLNFRYWYDEPGIDALIRWTENLQVIYLSCELLAGQLYPDEVFPNSGMTGAEHAAHALPFLAAWLDHRGRFGFAEWHSNLYTQLMISAVLNLVDFAQDAVVAAKAAMLIDLIAYDFANNYFKGAFATTYGRTNDGKVMGTSADNKPVDHTSDAAWLLLGISNDPGANGNIAAVALATSKRYAPPAILEDIAQDVLYNYEHRERSSIGVLEGPAYGIGYESEPDLMFWWGMSAPMASPVINATLDLIDEYNIDPALVVGDAMLLDFLKLFGSVHFTPLPRVSKQIQDVTRGVCLETVNTYTYRTPYYQLSGAQDHQKGMNGLQEHIWQASLDRYATVLTSSPGGIASQEFTGGWKPRATLYRNLGVIQYDRSTQLPVLELVFLALGNKPYNHAYFPQWAFDEVKSSGKWTFGRKGDSYIALYSLVPTKWQSAYELRAQGKKNVWIVELGSASENGSFENFSAAIAKAKIFILPLIKRFSVRYESPSRGLVQVSWNGPMTVAGQEVDLGPYPRYENAYCSQEFGTTKTVITRGDTQRLELDFEAATRTYSE
jgi:hypothetical protein